VAESHYAVITTTDGSEAAEELGRGIVEGRLGACVQIVGPNPEHLSVGGWRPE
jgi:periplasmic divalent cation tolerance protein